MLCPCLVSTSHAGPSTQSLSSHCENSSQRGDFTARGTIYQMDKTKVLYYSTNTLSTQGHEGAARHYSDNLPIRNHLVLGHMTCPQCDTAVNETFVPHVLRE